MAESKMFTKSGGEWQPVYPEPKRGAAPVLSGAPAATEIVYTWTAASGLTVASYEIEFDGVVENVGSVLTVTKTGLTTGSSHTARVRAKTDENVRGPWSNLLTTVAAVPFNDATGGTVTDVVNYNGTNETWRVHTFTANDSLVVNAAPQPFRVLVVGGGGSGGHGDASRGGGGGAGQMLEIESHTFTAGPHAVVVGNGGLRADWSSNKGGLSSIGALVAEGGGGGGCHGGPGATSGASGGGASATDSPGGATNQPVTGYPGGSGATDQSSYAYGGGGGGAGGAGGNANGGGGGAGGAGKTSNITGTAVVLASGGSGYYSSVATPGGGGPNGNPATANTGGGGGGNANGGSGVVIIAYKIA